MDEPKKSIGEKDLPQTDILSKDTEVLSNDNNFVVDERRKISSITGDDKALQEEGVLIDEDQDEVLQSEPIFETDDGIITHGLSHSGVLGRDRIDATLSNKDNHERVEDDDENPFTTKTKDIGVKIEQIVLDVNNKDFDKSQAEPLLASEIRSLEEKLIDIKSSSNDNPTKAMVSGVWQDIGHLKTAINRSTYSLFNDDCIKWAGVLRRKLIQLYNRYHKIKLPTSEISPTIQADALNFMFESKREDIQRRVKEINKFAVDGRWVEATDASRDMSDSGAYYEKAHEKGACNFMSVTEIPDVVTQFIGNTIKTDERFRECRELPTRVLEFGQGVLNDGSFMIRNLFNIIGYHAIDISQRAKDIAESRLQGLIDTGQAADGFGYRVVKTKFLDWFKQVPYDDDHYQGDLPKNERLIVFSKSTLHYFLRPIFEQFILPKLFHCVWSGRGLLTLAMKNPESDTWKDHNPIYEIGKEAEQGGYLCGLHKTQKDDKGRKLMRAYIERDTLLSMLEKAGFDVIAKDKKGQPLKDGNGRFLTDSKGNILISEKAVVERVEVPDYDYDNQTEVFTTVLARPKRVNG